MSKHLPKKENEQRHLKEPAEKRLRRAAPDLRTQQREHPYFALTKRNIAETAVAFVLFIATCILNFDGWLGLAAYAVVLLAALYTVLMRAVGEIADGNFLDESIPIIASSAAVFAIGDYRAGAAVMVFYRAAKLMEAWAANVNAKLYAGMRKTLPESVNVEDEHGIVEPRAPQTVAVGDIVDVAAGEVLAFDGVVVEGMSALDAALITDAAENFTVTVGERVYSGCVNTDAPIRMRVEELFDNSTASRVCAALENAAKYKSDYEKRAEKLMRVYTPAVSALAVLLAVVPLIFTGEWKMWIGRAAVLLALSNTAVFAAAASLSFLGGIAVSAGRGIVVKGTRFIEALARTKTMIFNKTGTLTEGRCTVTDVVPHGVTDYELLLIAARAEQYSDHPIGRAICAACGSFERDAREDVKTEFIPGRGISTVVRGMHIYVGNAALLEEHGIHCDIPRRGGAAIHVARNDSYCGYFVMNDRVREGAFDALEELRVMGVRNTVLLTDDVRSVARTVASSLNFEMVKPEQTPESKVSAVEYLLATKPERSALAVVCDRASDTEAMERADVGISLASLGSAAALNSADVLIMADDLRRLPEAMRTAKLAYGSARQNALAFAGVRLLLVVLAVCGAVSAFPAAAADIAASVLILANAYRTVHKKL